MFTLSRAYESCLACQHFMSKLLIGHLPCECNNGKGMLFSVEQAFVGRDEIRASLKTPAWEAMKVWDIIENRACAAIVHGFSKPRTTFECIYANTFTFKVSRGLDKLAQPKTPRAG